MNTLNTDQLVATQKAQLDTFFGLTQKAFEGVEKLVALNMHVVKSTLSDAQGNAQAVMSVKDAQELMTLQAGMLQPSAEKAAQYSRQLYEIMAGVQSELTRTAEATMAESQRKMLALVDTAVKNAPAGSENAVAMMKSAVAAANNALDSVQKATKQATEVAEANFTAMGDQATRLSQNIADTRKVA